MRAAATRPRGFVLSGAFGLGWAGLVLAFSVRAEGSLDGWADSTGSSDEPLLAPRPMLRRDADRPITVPDDSFAVWGLVGGGKLTVVDPAVLLSSGADYGIDDDFEIGLVLLRLVLSPAPDTGLSDPQVSLTFRWLEGIAEIAARATASIPFGHRFESALSLPLILRLGSLGRFDAVPDVHVRSGPQWVIGSSVPMSLRIQLGDAVTMGPIGLVSFEDLSRPDVFLSPGGSLAYTFGDEFGALADLRLSVWGPAIALSGAVPEDPTLVSRFSGALELRWFTEGPRDTAPFSEEL